MVNFTVLGAGVLFMVGLSLILMAGGVILMMSGQWGCAKASPYECGFDSSKGGSRVSFSLRFYLVMILFVIFDLEVILVSPVVLGVYGGSSVLGVTWWVSFMLILVLGYLYERRDGVLNWVEDFKVWRGSV